MDDRLTSFGSDITKQNVIPRTGTSQVEPVTSETELSCATTSTAKIEESEQIEERWFSESLEAPCETQSVTKRRRRKVDVAENRGKKLSVFGNLFSRWFPQNSGAANKSKCQFHYDVTLRKHMCHCDCHRYSLPLTRKELKRKIEQNRAPSRSGSLSYRMENLSRKGGISPMAQRSFDSIGSTVTPLQSKQRNKELNDSYCYARDSFC
uniref:Uncharacterized protein n=1 Tax=Ciona savignyi TaxID=51511 RepID=H2YJL5_CIOSA